jgi:hypothetical protein
VSELVVWGGCPAMGIVTLIHTALTWCDVFAFVSIPEMSRLLHS